MPLTSFLGREVVTFPGVPLQQTLVFAHASIHKGIKRTNRKDKSQNNKKGSMRNETRMLASIL